MCVLLCQSASTLASETTTDLKTETDLKWIPFKASYRAIMNGAVVDDNAVRELTHLGNQRFRLSAIAENFLFKLEEITEFQVQQQQIFPLQYQSSRSNLLQSRKKAAGFDWSTKKLHYQDRDKSGTRKLKVGTYDPLTSVFAVTRQLKAGEKNIDFKETDGRKTKSRHYRFLKEETLEIPYGKIHTLKLEKLSDDEKTTYLWLAPSLNYLTVKVSQTEEGKDYHLELQRYTPGREIIMAPPAMAVVSSGSNKDRGILPPTVTESLSEESPGLEGDSK